MRTCSKCIIVKLSKKIVVYSDVGGEQNKDHVESSSSTNFKRKPCLLMINNDTVVMSKPKRLD